LAPRTWGLKVKILVDPLAWHYADILMRSPRFRAAGFVVHLW